MIQWSHYILVQLLVVVGSFCLYSVDPSVCVKIAVMHFSSAADRWVQSVESWVRSGTWEQLCSMVLERFGKDQHELLIRQLFSA